ncbi:MAG: endonuclease III [Alphaproteobacteria bacterium]
MAQNIVMVTEKTVAAVFARFAAANPEPKTELNYTNPFTLLVAVVLSAQATDSGVNRATEKLFKIADTPQKMLKLGEAGLKDHIKTIGLFNSKARHIMALSQILIDQFDGTVPRTQKELETLPGVGQKTANVVRSVVFGDTTIAVDTHVFRVARRIGLASGATPAAVETQLLRIIPKKWQQHAHHWLILHGRYICKARKPDCTHCLIHDLCPSNNKSTPKIIR